MLLFKLSFTKQFWFIVICYACKVTKIIVPGSVVVVQADDGTSTFSDTKEFRDENSSCPPCPQCDALIIDNNDDEPITVQILVVDSQGIVDMVDWNARDYESYMNGTVKIKIKKAPTMPALFEEIENDARTGGGLFDAYYTNPVILGTAAIFDGFLDVTEYVKASDNADWTDVLLALRTYVTSFEGKVYIIPLDGDTHTLFYRRDVFDTYSISPPRTWNEYIDTAKILHGRVYNNITLSGSCVSRIQGDHAMYWSHLILSSITQIDGTASGSLFNPNDMTPLTGDGFAEMLRIQEEQAKYGTPDEFDKVVNHVNNAHMNDGSCALTFMWGDLFRRSKAEGSVLHDKLGVASTPGSEYVLNRVTRKLERCTKELCPYAKYYDDIGFVNIAPYAANGGWGGAISKNTSPEKQKALVDFFLWASSKEQSQQYVIPNATLPWYKINGQDPWRKSQLDVDKWVAQGYDRTLSNQYVSNILSNLVSKNVVVEARFPKAGEIMSVMDKEVNEYLVRAVKDESITESDKQRERLKVAQSVTDQWNQIIREYDTRGDTVAPILEIYQRLRGVYVPNEQKNYLAKIRPVGITFMAIIATSSFGTAIWVARKRKTTVVMASQPPFLYLICLGTLVMGSSIIPMGIDESVATQQGCSIACMATMWLLTIGFSICFAALFSKIWRLNQLMKGASQFRRIQVSVQDVLLPFAVLLVLNFAFLLAWTLIDPLYWERISVGRTQSGELESYGRCVSSGTTSIVVLSLIGTVNAIAVVLANIQVYQTRDLSVAYNESKFVGLSMASILQAALIGLPLLFLSDTNPTSRYVVRSLLVFVICMSTLGFIFLPKMLYSRNKDTSRINVSWHPEPGHNLRQSEINSPSNQGSSYFRRNSYESDHFRRNSYESDLVSAIGSLPLADPSPVPSKAQQRKVNWQEEPSSRTFHPSAPPSTMQSIEPTNDLDSDDVGGTVSNTTTDSPDVDNGHVVDSDDILIQQSSNSIDTHAIHSSEHQHELLSFTNSQQIGDHSIALSSSNHGAQYIDEEQDMCLQQEKIPSIVDSSFILPLSSHQPESPKCPISSRDQCLGDTIDYSCAKKSQLLGSQEQQVISSGLAKKVRIPESCQLSI